MEYPSFSRYARSALRLRKSVVFTPLFVMEYRAAIAEDDAAALTQLLEDGNKRKEEVDGR